MVEDRITDGRRIAQLLASELSGLERPPLDRVAVGEANPDATAASGGAFAYAVTVDGERVGAVYVHDDRARLTLPADVDLDAHVDERDGLSVSTDGEDCNLHVERGAAVKRAVDLLAVAIEEGY